MRNPDSKPNFASPRRGTRVINLSFRNLGAQPKFKTRVLKPQVLGSISKRRYRKPGCATRVTNPDLTNPGTSPGFQTQVRKFESWTQVQDSGLHGGLMQPRFHTQVWNTQICTLSHTNGLEDKTAVAAILIWQMPTRRLIFEGCVLPMKSAYFIIEHNTKPQRYLIILNMSTVSYRFCSRFLLILVFYKDFPHKRWAFSWKIVKYSSRNIKLSSRVLVYGMHLAFWMVGAKTFPWNFNCNMNIYLVIFDNWQCMPFLLCSQNMTWASRMWLLFQNIKNSMTATLLPVIITLMVRHYYIVINVYHSISEPYHLPMKPCHLIFKPYTYILPSTESLSLIFLNHTS